VFRANLKSDEKVAMRREALLSVPYAVQRSTDINSNISVQWNMGSISLDAYCCLMGTRDHTLLPRTTEVNNCFRKIRGMLAKTFCVAVYRVNFSFVRSSYTLTRVSRFSFIL
jgi:hypothetical protein